MEHVAINVYQDAHQNPGAITVADAIRALPHIKHADDSHLLALFENKAEIPAFLQEKQENKDTGTLLFAGTVHGDETDKQYIKAVYLSKTRGLVEEKYWLVYPMLEHMRFATVD